MNNQRIKIRLKSFDHRLLEKTAQEIVNAVKMTGAKSKGPIPLPRKIERFTVNRSPHVDKKSREQFEIRIQQRIIILDDATPSTIEIFKNIDLPAGIEVEIKLMSDNR